MSDVCLECSEKLTLIARQAAHDLRSPLSVLKLLLSCEFSQENAGEIRELAKAVVTRIESIAADLAREPQGKLNHTQESAEEVFTEICSEKSLEHSGAAIQVSIDPKICRYLLPAPDLKRALSNLVNNSVEAGARNIVLRAFPTGEDVEIAVRDDGRGMPAELVADLCSIESPPLSFGKPGGQGLGLMHLRRLTQSLGGSLSIESEPKKGTSIHLRIPRRCPN